MINTTICSSHDINLMRFNLQLAGYLYKCLVKHFIDSWWSTNPNFLDLTSVRHKLLLDVVRSPSGHLWAICLWEAYSCFEIVKPENLVYLLESFNQIETNRLFTALKGDIEVQLEARLVEITHFSWNILSIVEWESTLDEEVGDQVEEDKSTSACTESYMKTSRRELKTTSHWALDVEELVWVEHDSIWRNELLWSSISFVYACSKTLRSVVSL